MYIYVHIPEQRGVFWGIFLHISCRGEMDFGAQGYIVTDAAPIKPVKEGLCLLVSTSRASLTVKFLIFLRYELEKRPRSV